MSEGSDDQMYVLTKEQWRAMTVLHELMHLTGNLDGSHNGNLAAQQEGIVKNCIPDAERKTFTPDSPPGNTVDSNVPDTGSTSPVEIPLDEETDVTIGDDFEEVDLPESEEPVIDFGSDEPVLGDDTEVVPDPTDLGGHDDVTLGECCEEVPDPGFPGDEWGDPGYDDPGGYPDYYDPGYGGYDDGYGGFDDGGWYGGGGGGGGYSPENDPGYYDEYYYAEEFAY